ncbi:hypothetical protein D3C86_1712830 [compost metagenome]
MLQAIGPAVAVAQAVARHVVELQLALVAGLEIAELGAQVHPALGHQRARQRRVAVGRDVPVIRLGVFKATDIVEAYGQRQQARLALVRQRKAHHGNRQHGQALELQLGAARVADLLALVEVDVFGLEHPVRLPAGLVVALAGGVGGVMDHRTLVVQKIYF